MKRVLILTVMLLPSPLLADGLSDVLAEVYVDSPRLQAGRAALRAVDQELPIAQAGRWPTLSSSSYAGVSIVESGASGGDFAAARQSFTLRQPVLSGGAIGGRVARAGEQGRAERARLQALEQSVLLEAVEAFTAVALGQRVVELARQNERRLTDQLDATRERRRLGDAAQTDVELARTRHARAVAERIAIEGELQTLSAVYQQVTGQPPGNLAMPEPPDGLPASVEEALAAAAMTPEHEAARHDVDAARAGIEVARAAGRRQVALEAGASYAHDPADERTATRSASLGATVMIPLYQGGAIAAQVRQSRERVRESRHALDQASRRAVADASAAFAANATAGAQIASLEVQAEAAAFAVEGVRDEVRFGTRSVAEVLDAEEDLFSAEQALAEARRHRRADRAGPGAAGRGASTTGRPGPVPARPARAWR